ncbi:O-methyltransferase [Mycolicibacterium chitae]|uniref:O-methyl transferase mdmC n=1 Tax=Mycolicibacterium chitae TaxID=1792 RepID=A0A448ICF2_MYCCI|nr:O-methyltransferase [Mycolicibacterium chitae]MCV7104346.1 O-methyltransferase [Mycolicibacterium chitae]BBZ01323.1 O-methyltransferase [Mycolicibacterium chitae]VEG50162.1 O-methyl transferase mdmC [Mycolicibacterium chitae]
MNTPTPQEVDELLNRVVLGEDPALAAALADSTAAGLPSIEVTPQAAKFLGLLVRMSGARRVLEIGTLGGYSAICLARAVGPEGSVVTLEYEPRHAEVAAANLARAGMADRVEIVVGAALDTLPTLSGKFDFVFIDADKENNLAYLQWALDLGRPGTVIVVDNVIRNGRILDPAADDAQARAVRETLEEIGRHPRLDAAALQTVGGKGWDGFAIALVR